MRCLIEWKWQSARKAVHQVMGIVAAELGVMSVVDVIRILDGRSGVGHVRGRESMVGSTAEAVAVDGRFCLALIICNQRL